GGASCPTGATPPPAPWALSRIPVDTPPMPEPDKDVNRFLVTLRLRVVAHSQTLGDVTGTMRKTIHIQRDPDLLPGYPIFLGASGEASPKLADLDGDGRRELVIADADGRVHAFDARGGEMPGWPFTVSVQRPLARHRGQPAIAAGAVARLAGAPIIATPAVGDLDGDGTLEVVIATRGGEVWALRRDGRPLPGFPVEPNLSARPGQDP